MLSDFLSGADDDDVDDDDELCPPFVLALMTLTPWSILPVINVIVLAKGSHTGPGRAGLALFIFMLFGINTSLLKLRSTLHKPERQSISILSPLQQRQRF